METFDYLLKLAELNAIKNTCRCEDCIEYYEVCYHSDRIDDTSHCRKHPELEVNRRHFTCDLFEVIYKMRPELRANTLMEMNKLLFEMIQGD